jgi:hypothetical protein
MHRVYLDGSQSGSTNTPKGTATVRVFTFAVVSTTDGTLTLPKIRLNWFDTVVQQTRIENRRERIAASPALPPLYPTRSGVAGSTGPANLSRL